MIYRPTPKQIYEYMMATYNGYLPAVTRESYIDGYFFSVYVPNDFDSISLIGSRKIIQEWMRIIGNDSTFNISDWLRRFKRERFYTIQTENLHTYDWFILLSICSENNFIIDSILNNNFEGTIYDIEPVSKRLKVRI